MRKPLAITVLAVAVLAVGVAHGLQTDRWRSGPGLADAAGRVAALPARVGDWEGTDDPSVTPDEMARAGVKGYVLRRYVNRDTGRAVNVLLVCGRSGPICVHTPEVCYGGAGYELAGEPRVKEIPAADPDTPAGRFLTARFKKSGNRTAAALDISWGWGADGRWDAPDNARLAYVRQPYLYKLYVIREAPAAVRPDADESPAEFLKLLLPELRKTLFAPVPGA
jgi:hypothetical protein